MRRRAKRALATSLAFAFAFTSGCGGNAPNEPIAASSPAPRHAPGTVLVVGEREISAADVDRVAAWIAKLYPQSADAHNRRRALTAVLLRNAALAEAHKAARATAFERARGVREELVAGRVPAGVEVLEVTGTWGKLNLEIFGPAHELEGERWSEPVEGFGRVLLLRVLERSGGPELGAVVLKVELVEFPFVPEGSTPESIESDIDTQRLVVVDPAWAEYVPIAWQYRLRGGKK